MSDTRIIDQTTDTTLVDGDYVIVDSQNEGTRKYNLGKGINEIKQDLQNIIDGGGGSGSGWTEYQQGLLITILRSGLYSSDQSNNIDALEDSFEVQYTNIVLNQNSISISAIGGTSQLTATTTPAGGSVTWSSSNPSVATVSSSGLVTATGYGSATITASIGGLTATCSVTVAQATLVSISAAYTQSGTVYTTDSLDSLKADLVVTATWSNSTTSTVPSADYTLSGTLTEGTSTITVSYGGKSTTFTVTVTAITIHSISYSDGDFSYNVSDSVSAAYDENGTDITSEFTGGTLHLWQTDAISANAEMSVALTVASKIFRKTFAGSYDRTTKTVHNAVVISNSPTQAGDYSLTVNVLQGEGLGVFNFGGLTNISEIEATWQG